MRFHLFNCFLNVFLPYKMDYTMITTNVIKKEKKRYNSEEQIPLSANNMKKLTNAILGHGNLKKAKKETGLSGLTIKRASMGFRVNPDTKSKLEKFLNQL